MEKYTIESFRNQFPNDDACLDFLKESRWPDGITCSTCKRVTKHFRISGRKCYGCEFCGTQIYPTAGTIFHKSPTPLLSWFHAIFLMASTRTGISAKQLERELGVTYKTAWRMFDKIRKLMSQDDVILWGEVEVDETYIGGRRPGKRGRGAAGKSVVAGIVERKGQAVVKVVPDVKAETLLPMIQEHVPPGATVYTDELKSYRRLSSLGYAHKTIQHQAKEYVVGRTHTNNIEGMWSNVKRGIDGVNHAVSPRYLQSYLDAYVFRFNHRSDETPMFVQLLGRAVEVQ